MTNNLITIGKRVDTKGREDVQIDVLKLILTRLLICANSGGGKSWILRRLAELLFPIMPCIIFDWEGEFATLREKFDFVLVGKGGETPADCRSAKIVILKLLELRVSAVIDLSELTPADKHRYVRLACEAAINSPKEFWRPTAFIFDEVHEVCPENGKGQSEAKQAVLAFPTKGRKRRFLSIFATQRLHKLALDARAEMLNRMIGMTFEPDDLKVAASILGIGREGMDKFKHEMRTMEAGNFFAFGRAISLETILLKVGPVQTSHESEHAKYGPNAPPPTAKIKAMLPQLADLPKQAEDALNTEAELRAEVTRLRTELKQTSNIQPKEIKPVTTAIDIGPLKLENKTLRKQLEAIMKFLVQINTHNFSPDAKPEDIRAAVQSALDKALPQIESKIQAKNKEILEFKKRAQEWIDVLEKSLKEKVEINLDVKHNAPVSVSPARPVPPIQSQNGHGAAANGDISRVGQKILNALAEMELLGSNNTDREIVALLAGYSNLKSEGFVKAVSELRTAGYVQYPNSDSIAFTEAGRGVAVYPSAPRSSEEIQARVCSLIGGKASEILKPLLESYPDSVARETVAAAANYTNLKSEGFVKAVSRLRTLGFVDYPDTQSMRATDILFLK